MTMIEGVSVEVLNCGHCKAIPSSDEIRAAIKTAQTLRECPQYCCIYCGESIKVISYDVQHTMDTWGAHETEVEPSISLRMHHSKRREIGNLNLLHVRCLKNALPYVNGLNELL